MSDASWVEGFSHSSVYIVRVVDAGYDDETRVWFVGPYGHTRANLIANDLDSAVFNSKHIERRDTFVEELFSNQDCLRVDDYRRREFGSLT